MNAPKTETLRMRDDLESEQDLEALVLRAKGGDRRAFEKIVQALRPRIARRVRLKLGCKLRQQVDAEEVVQDTFVEVFRLLPAFSWTRNGSLVRWIEAIAEHQVQRAVRGQKRRCREVAMPRSSQLDLQSIGGMRPFVAQGTSPSEVVVHNEAIDRVHRALGRMKTDRRNVVLLAHGSDLKTKEVAARLGRSPQAVAVLLFRAVRQLRHMLKC
jgi:RNA polymerase sigma factor (sigma-70 family)